MGGSICFSKAIFHISSRVDNYASVHRDYAVCLAACYKTLDGFYRPPSYSDRIAYRGKQEKLSSVKRILGREREKGSDVAACELPRNKYEIYGDEGRGRSSTPCEVVSTFCQLRYVHVVMLRENSNR